MSAGVLTALGILVRGADFTLVYDAGSNDDLARGPSSRMLAYFKALAPTLTTVDHLILSHPHRDSVELLPDLFAAYQVRRSPAAQCHLTEYFVKAPPA